MITRTSTIETLSACRDCQNPPITCKRIVGRKPIVLVLDYPSHLEAKKGSLLQGDTGRLVRSTLKALDIDIRDVHVITALNCKPNTSKPKELRTAMECCRARLLRELRSLHAEKVLCLGTIGYTALTSTNKIPRMDKVHGRWVPVYGMQLMGTYSPTRVILEPEFFRDWIKAFTKFFTTSGREPWPDITFTVPSNAAELYNAMFSIGAFSEHQLSCDIETTGFSPFEDEILALGFGSVYSNGVDGEVVIVSQELLADKDAWWLIANQLDYGHTSFHNGKFDLKFIIQAFRKHRMKYRFGTIDDTMLLNYCLDERPMGKYGAHSLKNMSRIRYDAPDYDIDVGKWLAEYKQATPERQKVMMHELHYYLALDCYYTARLTDDLRRDVEAESDKLLDFYEWLLMPASMALTEIELYGCKLDRKYLEDMRDKLLHDLEVSTQKIREYAEEPTFNPASSKQVHKLFYEQIGFPIVSTGRKGKLQEGPTSQPVMRILRGRYPEHRYLFDELIKWRQLQKTLGTYVNGLLSRMEFDDRVRCSFLLHGTGTGRLSSANPNLQNIQTHTGIDVRAAFIPEDDDWVWMEADYSQLELRVAAHLTGDENFIQVYLDDGDLHQDAVSAIFQKSADDVTSNERRMAKNTVFGAMYDRGPESLANGPEMQYMVNELGVEPWTLDEVRGFFHNLFASRRSSPTQTSSWGRPTRAPTPWPPPRCRSRRCPRRRPTGSNFAVNLATNRWWSRKPSPASTQPKRPRSRRVKASSSGTSTPTRWPGTPT